MGKKIFTIFLLKNCVYLNLCYQNRIAVIVPKNSSIAIVLPAISDRIYHECEDRIEKSVLRIAV